jgi:hypothetical protein
MQTIIRTAPASNFTIFSNDFIASTMPPVAKAVLLYLLTKPKNWQLRRTDLKKQLALTGYAIQKALKWLQQNGYAWFTRFCGKCTWYFTDTPKPRTAPPAQPPQQETATAPVFNESFDFEYVENRHDLVITETNTKKETTTITTLVAESITEVEVVVDELIYPVQLSPSQKKAARHKIKKLKQPELQQEVLFALAYYMTQGVVKIPVAYLDGIVTRANNGTFEAITATSATKQGGKPLIPIWQGFGQSTPSKPEVAKGFINQIKAGLRGAS